MTENSPDSEPSSEKFETDIQNSIESSPKPAAPVHESALVTGISLNRENEEGKTLEARLEAKIIRVLRREVRDPYGGLPADDVLVRLHERFPEHNFPGRMLSRIELEQTARHDREQRQDEVEKFVVETDRINGKEDRDLQRSWGKRAERIVVFLTGTGILFVFTDHEEIGGIVLGTTLIGVVGSFLAQTIRKKL